MLRNENEDCYKLLLHAVEDAFAMLFNKNINPNHVVYNNSDTVFNAMNVEF